MAAIARRFSDSILFFTPVFVLGLIILISPVSAADMDDEGFYYQAEMLVNKQQSIEIAQLENRNVEIPQEIPRSLQYKYSKAKKVQNHPSTTAQKAENDDKEAAEAAPHELIKPVERQQAAAKLHLSTEPIMIIRFNQPSVYYHTPLYNIVQKAVEIKPDAYFTVKSLIPATGNNAVDAEQKVMALENGRGVVRNLQEMELPQKKISINYIGSNKIRNNEVHIFVR